jgi:hypothetical protein
VSYTIHKATRLIPEDADRRIALDRAGLPFHVIVDGAIAYDERIYPFPELSSGIPIEQMTFAEDSR